MKHPPVLILMSDEHRADVAGFAGDPVVRTPTLDWLAEGGVVFENAYTPSPICVPARQCIFSGQYPKTCGCEGWIGLQPGHMTYPRRFAQHGYKTAAFGKAHLVGEDQLAGFQMRPAGDVQCNKVEGSLVGGTPEWVVQTDDPLNVPNDMKWSDEKELRGAGPGWGSLDKKDEMATLAAEQFIDDRYVGTWNDGQMPDKPALLYAGFINPHYGYTAREDLFRYYLPRVRGYEVEECFDHPFLGLSPWPPRPLQAGKDIPQRIVQRGRAAYYAKTETMDGHCGRILDALRLAGQDLDEWIIVYLSDHGDMLGEHGVWEKQKFFEGSVRAPFIIRWPGGGLPGGRRVRENVSLCDLFATLCELTGVALPEGPLDSRSLVPLMKGEATSWDDEVCSFFLQQGFSNVMVKRGALKYQTYHHEDRGVMPGVLFDVEADPLERTNLVDEPAYAGAVDELRARVRELGYGHTLA